MILKIPKGSIVERLWKNMKSVASSESKEEDAQLQSPLRIAKTQLPLQEEPNKTTSRREEDMSAEAELARFLDQYLYSRFPNKQRYSSIKRIRDKSEQLKGTDVRFTMKDGRVFNVDEKAQLYYLNKDLPTFAFEIQFLRHGFPTTGWLCNNCLDTDYYLLIWPFANRDKPYGISWRDFTKADCLMISKHDVLSFLARIRTERLVTKQHMKREFEGRPARS